MFSFLKSETTLNGVSKNQGGSIPPQPPTFVDVMQGSALYKSPKT